MKCPFKCKCIKYLVGLYGAMLLTVLAGIFVACTIHEGNNYIFDVANYDQVEGISQDSLQLLFTQGVTVKEYKNKLYYIQNTTDNELNCNLDTVIDFGPITIDRERGEDFNKFCKLEIENRKNGRSDVKLSLDLTSKFEGKIDKIILSPAWVSYSTTRGLCGINLLRNITMDFKNGLVKDNKFSVKIPWDCYTYHIQSDPVMISIKLDCYLEGTTEEYFSEIINLNVDNHRIN